MNEHESYRRTPPAPASPDDVWGANRPPVLGPPSTARDGVPIDDRTVPRGGADGAGAGASQLDQGLAALRRAPLHRDSANGVLGGVCAGIAERTGLSVAAVRVAAVVLALFFGAGVGAYLIAWAALPDERQRTHVEDAVRSGRPRSMAILALGGLAVLGVLGWLLESWPLLIAVAVVAYVVAKKKGHFSPCSHG